MGSLIDARGLTVRYRGAARARDDAPAIADLDLRADAGEVVGVLGPNGAGKSTLLRVLATLRAPSAGELRLMGEPAYPPRAALRRRTGYAGDSPVHLDALSGRENAIFFARAAAVDRRAAEDAVDRLADRLGLSADLDRPAGEYSLGMRRKLFLIEALAHEPALVLLDEPTLGLDTRGLDALAALLAERAGGGAAVLLATNDVGFAQRACDRVVFLHRGRVVLEGAPASLLRRARARSLIDVRVEGRTPDGLELDGAEVRRPEPGHLHVLCDDAPATLPALAAALADAGARVRSIHVRETDLRDVFLEATGAPLGAREPGDAAAADPGTGVDQNAGADPNPGATPDSDGHAAAPAPRP